MNTDPGLLFSSSLKAGEGRFQQQAGTNGLQGQRENYVTSEQANAMGLCSL